MKCVQYLDFASHTAFRCPIVGQKSPHLLERNFPACSEKIFFSLHLFFRDLLSIDNVGIIVICGTDLIMGQYTNIRYLAQLSAMEEYSLWVGERKPDVNLQMRRSPAEIGRRSKHRVSPVLMPTCPVCPWINQFEPVIFGPDSQNYVREKKTRLSSEIW